MSVKIITDSISDISVEVSQQYGIDVLPINVVLGDRTYKDDDNFSQEVLAEWIEKNGEFPIFRGINPDYYKGIFKEYESQNIDMVVITADERIISNYDCALHAATAITGVKIFVINGNTNSSGQAILALKAADMVKKGYSAEKVADEIQKLIQRPEMHIEFDNIKFLRNTKYCPTIMKVGESLLNVKYHFSVVIGKEYSVETLPSNSSKAIEKYCKSAFKKYDKVSRVRLVIMHTINSEENLEYVLNYAKELNHFEDIVILPCKSYSTAIGGRNSVGFAFIPRIS